MKSYVDPTFGDFQCIHCRYPVSANPILSGVGNRNHCPYCLRSRHLDLFKAGDRLAACKGKMEPLGLTLKKTFKKYAHDQPGELMIVHGCCDCGKLSANRIAADDDPQMIVKVFKSSLKLDINQRFAIERQQITLLNAGEDDLVAARLFGQGKRIFA